MVFRDKIQAVARDYLAKGKDFREADEAFRESWQKTREAVRFQISEAAAGLNAVHGSVAKRDATNGDEVLVLVLPVKSERAEYRLAFRPDYRARRIVAAADKPVSDAVEETPNSPDRLTAPEIQRLVEAFVRAALEHHTEQARDL